MGTIIFGSFFFHVKVDAYVLYTFRPTPPPFSQQVPLGLLEGEGVLKVGSLGLSNNLLWQHLQ